MFDNNRTEKIDKNNLLGSLRKGQFLGKCPDIFSRATVTPQGFMSPCCIDYQNYLAVADLNITPVKEAWNGEIFVNLRKKHIANNLSGVICDNCLNNSNRPVAPLIPSCARLFKKKERKISSK